MSEAFERIERCESLKVASSVLRQVENLFYASHPELSRALGITLQVYSNGREQGLFLRNYRFAAAFSEARNSDQIVVYRGKQEEFKMNGNIPSEAIWKEASYFKYDDQVGAARSIMEMFLDTDQVIWSALNIDRLLSITPALLTSSDPLSRKFGEMVHGLHIHIQHIIFKQQANALNSSR